MVTVNAARVRTSRPDGYIKKNVRLVRNTAEIKYDAAPEGGSVLHVGWKEFGWLVWGGCHVNRVCVCENLLPVL